MRHMNVDSMNIKERSSISEHVLFDDFPPMIGSTILIGKKEIYIPDAFDIMMQRKDPLEKRLKL